MTEPELYERFVKTLYERYLLSAPGASKEYQLHHRKNYRGLKTGNLHEIDLSFETTIGGMKILVLIECKYYSRRVGKGIVEELHSKMDDIGAHKSAIVTTVGFQKGALKAAKAYGIALVIATVQKGWLERPDQGEMFEPQWRFLNHGYIPVPFFGPWPIGCAHHAEYFVEGLVSSLKDEIERKGHQLGPPPWQMHPHLPPEGRRIIHEDGIYEELGWTNE